MSNLFFVLGANDPEMVIISRTLEACGVFYTFAVTDDGKRVHPGNAAKATGVTAGGGIPDGAEVVVVECRVAGIDAVVVDHHSPGDPGFGVPAEDFWKGSSIGQVWEYLTDRGFGDALAASGLKDEAVLAAAADHCLGAAYKGRCPGVTPTALRAWRAETRARFQGSTAAEISAAVDAAIEAVRGLPTINVGGHAVAVAGEEIRELPEAASITGIPVMYELFDVRAQKTKVGLLGADEEVGAAWMDWARANHNLEGVYGDPKRGFAGAYKVAAE